MPKVIAFNCSPRVDGNTARMLNKVLDVIKKEGFETELINLGSKPLSGCTACNSCFKNKDKRCIINGDNINEYIDKMISSSAIIIGSPTYYADITPQAKALIDRVGFVSMANGGLFKRKLGAAVVTMRRAGGIHAFDSINHFFTIGEMIVVGSNYWNIGLGREKGEVKDDKEAMKTMKILGENISWLISKLYS
ncbi:MAG: flavodoxin family protein [Elusimicrobiales bacterium]|jgi:multimeric flavodoxin WrbA|nr:flavodoxin family protein [Elusimicrobiales bacterium]